MCCLRSLSPFQPCTPTKDPRLLFPGLGACMLGILCDLDIIAISIRCYVKLRSKLHKSGQGDAASHAEPKSAGEAISSGLRFVNMSELSWSDACRKVSSFQCRIFP